MTPGGVGKTYAFWLLVAGMLLMGWNYRRRQRGGVLRAELSSDEFASLVVAITTTTLAFSALAFFDAECRRFRTRPTSYELRAPQFLVNA